LTAARFAAAVGLAAKPPRRAAAEDAEGRTASTLRLVTAKEKLMERAPYWTEEQAARALRAAEGDEIVDEWGDLTTLHDVTTAETMRRLADEERVAGQKPW
jgi:hypothetical protein